MTAVVDDTLCSLMSGSAPAAKLVQRGTNSSLVIDGLLTFPDGRLAGTMNLELHGTIGLGEHELTSLVFNPADFTTSGSVGCLFLASRGTTWSTDVAHVGTLSLTRLDTAAQRVEGTFSFDGVNAVTGEIRPVRQGKFSCSLTVSS